MSKFLYGAAVQGIQSFIFQTNKLREIVGASELVEEICSTLFASIVYDKPEIKYEEAKDKLKSDEKAILFAAGNIKYIFDTKEQCEKIVKVFPKIVSEFAPGISASQSVVKIEDEDFESAVNALEKNLRTQRNKQMRSQTLSLMGIQRSRQTGLPVISRKDDEGKYGIIDAATWAKLYEVNKKDNEVRKRTTKTLCQKAFGFASIKEIDDDWIAYNIEDITKDNDWIAIIHADGNGLGQIVQKIGTDKDKFKTFSQNLDKATTEAAVAAYEAVKQDFNKNNDPEKLIPIRPIVLGGDDLTVVCRGDLALKYVTKFIEEFEEKTSFVQNYKDENGKNLLPFNKLTACAGIAYVKSSYPFYYGYELAESLCSRAKKYAKDKETIKKGEELPLSCLMFHKVQSSFVEEYDEIVKKELTPQENISFEFGPYFINSKKEEKVDWTVDELLNNSKQLDSKDGNAVKSHLRNWLTLLHNNEDMAKQKLERLKSMTEKEELKRLIKQVTDKDVKRDGKIIYPVYDILAIHTINTQKTKGNE